MANQIITADANLEDVIALGLANGENVTVNNGAILTVTQTPSVLIGLVSVNEGEIVIDGENISANNCLNFVGENANHIYASGQGTIRVKGGWYSLGTTTGASNQVVDLTSYWTGTVPDVVPAIWIETGRRINYVNAVGSIPEVDDWIYTTSGFQNDPKGRIVEVQDNGDGTGYVVVKFLVGSIVDGENIRIKKIVDNLGPDFQTAWTATANGADVKEVGIYQEFGNCGVEGNTIANTMNLFNTGMGGFVFHNVQGDTFLTLGGTSGGFIPPAGCDIKIPNVHFSTASTTTYGTGYYDSGTIETNAYELSLTGAGCYFDVCNVGSAWFGPSYAAIFEASYVGSNYEFGSGAAAEKTIYKNCVVVSPLLGIWASSGYAFRCVDLVNGCLIEDCLVVSGYTTNLKLGAETSIGVVIKNCIATTAECIYAGSGTFQYTINKTDDALIDNCVSYTGMTRSPVHSFFLYIATNTQLKRLKISQTQQGSSHTVTAYPLTIQTQSNNVSLVGMEFLEGAVGATNVDKIYVLDSSNIKIRAIGNVDDKVEFGTDGRYTFSATGLCSNLDVARVYKTGGVYKSFLQTTTTLKNVIIQNCAGDYDGRFQPRAADNIVLKGLHAGSGLLGGGSGIEDNYSSAYGRQIHDGFKSDTEGFISCNFIAPSSAVNLITKVQGNPKFFRDGDLDMVDGDILEVVQDYYSKGHTAFTGEVSIWYSANRSWGTDDIKNNTIYFQYDVGSGWNGTWLDIRVPSNLTSVPVNVGGTRIKLRIEATGNCKDWHGIVLSTTTSIQDQKDNLYPIDQETYAFKLTGLIEGSEVRLLKQGTLQELAGVETSGTEFIYNYDYTGDIPVYVVIHNNSYKYIRLETTLSNENASIPIQQQFDRNYKNN